jgi:endonuclease/exonuclease/phosphatase (EEP) superfamily protein YafD
VQYLWILLALAIVLPAQKMWRATAGAAALLALNVFLVLPLYFGAGSAKVSSDNALSVLSFNVNIASARYQDVADYVASQDADVVIIIEASASITSAVTKALPSYEVLAADRVDAFGIALYSKLPMSASQVTYLGGTDLPSIAATVTKSGTTYSVLAVHTMPPISGSRSAMRDRMLGDAAKWAREQSNALVVGDLNTTPWSHAFGKLLEDGKLVNSQRGFGVQSSWPTGNWFLSIPLDHALHSDSLVTLERSLGPLLGSDHRPLRVRVGAALD